MKRIRWACISVESATIISFALAGGGCVASADGREERVPCASGFSVAHQAVRLRTEDSMSETLKVESRELRGKRNNRRLRARGRIPAVLYGHGQDPVSLAVPAEQFDAMIRHGSRLVTLAGAVNESAFVRECQWDTWGHHVVHVDFTRISAHEKVAFRWRSNCGVRRRARRRGGV